MGVLLSAGCFYCWIGGVSLPFSHPDTGQWSCLPQANPGPPLPPTRWETVSVWAAGEAVIAHGHRAWEALSWGRLSNNERNFWTCYFIIRENVIAFSPNYVYPYYVSPVSKVAVSQQPCQNYSVEQRSRPDPRTSEFESHILSILPKMRNRALQILLRPKFNSKYCVQVTHFF